MPSLSEASLVPEDAFPQSKPIAPFTHRALQQRLQSAQPQIRAKFLRSPGKPFYLKTSYHELLSIARQPKINANNFQSFHGRVVVLDLIGTRIEQGDDFVKAEPLACLRMFPICALPGVADEIDAMP